MEQSGFFFSTGEGAGLRLGGRGGAFRKIRGGEEGGGGKDDAPHCRTVALTHAHTSTGHLHTASSVR